MRLEIDKFIFLGLLRHFLAGMNGLIFFWARPLKMTFFRPLYYVLDAFLKKRMALASYLKVVPEVLKEGED